jgi:catechol-2,3-dioxygenase
MISNDLKSTITIHHVVLTIRDLKETEQFYTKIFGPSLILTTSTAIYLVGQTMLIFMQKTSVPSLQKFNPSNIGLEHLAFGLNSLSELQLVHEALTANEITNSGIHVDESSHKEKIWFNDPSDIRVEFYL